MRIGGTGYTPEISEQDAVFIFRGDTLVDMSDRGRQLLESIMAASDGRRDDLEHLLRYLDHRFLDLRSSLGRLVGLGQMELQAQDDSGLILRASRKKGLTHLRLIDTRAEGAFGRDGPAEFRKPCAKSLIPCVMWPSTCRCCRGG